MRRRYLPEPDRRRGVAIRLIIVVAVLCGLVAAATAGLSSSGAAFSAPTANETNTFEAVSVNSLLAEAEWWLDATASTSLYSDDGCSSPASAGGTAVNCWADARANGNAIVSVDANDPIVSTTPISDLRSLRLDDGALRGPDLLGGSVTDAQVYIVSRENERVHQVLLSLNGDDRTNSNRFDVSPWATGTLGETGTIIFDPGDIFTNRSSSAAPVVGAPYLFDGFKDSVAGVSGHQVDNNAIAYSSSNTAASTAGGLQLGTSLSRSDVGEVIIFSRRLSSFEDGLLREYLFNKWSLGVNDLLSGATWWLDPAVGSLYSDTSCTTSAITADAEVRCWTDRRANGNKLLAATTDLPTNSANPIGGRRSVQFNNGHMLGPDLFGTDLYDAQIFVVTRENVRKQSRTFSLDGTQFTTEAFAAHLPWTDGKTYFDTGTVSIGRSQSTAPPMGTPMLFNGWKDSAVGNSGHQISRGAKAYSAGNPAGHTAGGLLLGNTLRADIAEVIIFNRRLTQAEEDQVQSYLANKWSIS